MPPVVIFLAKIAALMGVIGFPLCLALKRRAILPWFWVPTAAACSYMTILLLIGAQQMLTTRFAPGPGGGGEFMVPLLGLFALGGALVYGVLAGVNAFALRHSKSSYEQWARAIITWFILVSVATFLIRYMTNQHIVITVVDLNDGVLENVSVRWKVQESHGRYYEGQGITNSHGQIEMDASALYSLRLELDWNDPIHYAAVEVQQLEGQDCDGFYLRSLRSVRLGEKSDLYARVDPRVAERSISIIPASRSIRIRMTRGDEYSPDVFRKCQSELGTFAAANIPHTSVPGIFPEAFTCTNANRFLDDLLNMKATASNSSDQFAASGALRQLMSHNGDVLRALPAINEEIETKGFTTYKRSIEALAEALDVQNALQQPPEKNVQQIGDILRANNARIADNIKRPY